MSSLLDRLSGDSTSAVWIKTHLDYPHKEWCLKWPWGLNQGGYAQVGKMATLVHRIMCEHRHGPAPADKPFAAHECGNGTKGCVNPWHVSWKTHSENMHDMHRHTPRVRRYKLTPTQVDEIRELQGRARIRDIAERFGVNAVTIRQIHSGKIWKQGASNRHVFTDAEVLRIRAYPSGVKGAAIDLAKEFGVSINTIHNIRNGRSYGDAPASSLHPSHERGRE